VALGVSRVVGFNFETVMDAQFCLLGICYPLAVAGALMVGLIESFSSFWASALKEVIVFSLVIPVLAWRSLTHRELDEDGA